MSDAPSAPLFDETAAATYDTRYAKLARFKETLHLCIEIALRPLPDEARVLVVGAGTGAELVAMAREHPRWQFVAVDPAAPMLRRCRERAEAEGVADRCTYHTGTLETLAATEPFDAATSLLVSHFIMDPGVRRRFFEQIAVRLTPTGRLVTADLAMDPTAESHEADIELWREALAYAGFADADIDAQLASWNRHVAVAAPRQIEAWMVAGGFSSATLIFQGLRMHAWLARKR